MLEMAMRSTQAWELLNTPEYCGKLDMEGYHKLLLEAGYTQQQAQRAANERGWQRLEAGVKL